MSKLKYREDNTMIISNIKNHQIVSKTYTLSNTGLENVLLTALRCENQIELKFTGNYNTNLLSGYSYDICTLDNIY